MFAESSNHIFVGFTAVALYVDFWVTCRSVLLFQATVETSDVFLLAVLMHKLCYLSIS